MSTTPVAGPRAKTGFLFAAAAAVLLGSPAAAQEPGDWTSYGRDAGAGRYSPLTQITPANVARLKPAWTYHMRPAASGDDDDDYLPSEATPLVVKGVMYLPTPYGRVVALDADTGKPVWTYTLPASDVAATRGVAYWPGGNGQAPRILVGTRRGRLIALDAATGAPAAGFGDGGVVDLRTPEVMNGAPTAPYGMSSPPFVFRDLVITGSRVQEYPARGPSGDVRAWDVRTGKLVWTFHTVPRPGEAGHETWEGDSWKNRSGVNAWTSLAGDPERGIVYLPVAAPAFDRWGVDRKGANLFADSVVAVDAATGRRLWHFQLVHHDLWDSDVTALTLAEVKRGGRTIPAIAAVNKMAILFILDRVTGKPIYDVKETPTPQQTDVPGEQPWPTQPIPIAPPPLGRQSFTMADLDDLTPEVKARCEKLVKDWNVVESKMYQPPRLGAAVAHFPGGEGGVLWGGAAFDPKQGYYIVDVTNMASPAQLGPQPDGGYGLAYGYRYFWDAATRIPCQKPPWGELMAVDVNSGEIAWRTTVGVTDSLPAGLRDTGRPLAGGLFLTASGLVFIGATDDNRFRAFDSHTGKLLWEAKLPASIYATPMTYKGRSGKQYVAAVVTGGMTGGDAASDDVTAFTLP
jgi:quinoprotein glucose dehydrogenase